MVPDLRLLCAPDWVRQCETRAEDKRPMMCLKGSCEEKDCK